MINTIDINDFRQRASSCKVLDVRSEQEFAQGHFPGAINFPLLNNEERIAVGTCYKQNGREAAVLLGFDLVGHKFGDFVRKATELAPEKDLLIYCWRGGMRSNIMAWTLNMAGFRCNILKGGYKSFRGWALDTLAQPKQIIILGGMTGCGKTPLLLQMKVAGEQVIDLEGLANHKGSAFGALGQPKQPPNEHFDNLLALQWTNIQTDKPVWLENESRLIGFVKVPDTIYEAMRIAPVVEVVVSREARIAHILQEYGQFPTSDLAACTAKLAKRLGNLRLQQALTHLENNELPAWTEMMLDYYDKSYTLSSSQRLPSSVHPVVLNSNYADKQAVIDIIAMGKRVMAVNTRAANS